MKKTITLLFTFLLSLSVFSQSKGLHFDGVNDRITAPITTSNTTFGNAITIEAWIKTDSVTLANQTIVNRGGTSTYSLYLTSNKLAFIVATTTEIYGGFVQTPYTFNKSWHHVAGVYNGATMQLYIDGLPAGAPYALTGNVTVDNGEVLTMGYFPPVFSSYFRGTMDEVRIWNVARTQAQIQASMNSELSAATNPALRVNYRFNQGNANGVNTGQTSLYDHAARVNNGTLTNFALTGTASNFTTGYGSLVPLPVINTSFAATKKEGTVLLSWKGQPVISSTFFEIERSTDDLNFSTIGSVAGPASGSETLHSFTDVKPAAANYYRLKSTEDNGQVSYSKTILVKIGDQHITLQAYPNPAQHTLQLQFSAPDGLVEVRIIDLTGRTIERQQVTSTGGVTYTSVDIHRLKKGLYIVSANGEAKLFTKE